MSQILHIFKKDTRHFWVEILISIGALGAFAWAEPKSWSVLHISVVPQARMGLLVVVFVSWITPMVRAVQDEALVGTNQFWTTRPYEWPKLLAAKVMFLLVFFYLPLALMQMHLLHVAHLPVVANMPLLLWNLLNMTGLLVLPVLCIAAVTRVFPQALIGMVIALVAVLAVGSFGIHLHPGGTEPLWLPAVVATIVVVPLLTVVLWQYWRRQARTSIGILVCMMLVLTLVLFFIPGTGLAARGYAPSSAASVGVQMDMDPTSASGGRLTADREDIFLNLPLKVDPRVAGRGFMLKSVRATLTGTDGHVWQSPWTQDRRLYLTRQSGVRTTYVQAAVPRAEFDRLTQGNVTVHIEMLLAVMADGTPIDGTISDTGELVPGLGYCSLDVTGVSIVCAMPFDRLQTYLVQAQKKMGRCDDQSAHMMDVQDYHDGFDQGPFGAMVGSVDMRGMLYVSGSGSFCNGTKIRYTPIHEAQRLRVDVPAMTLDLKRYAGVPAGVSNLAIKP